MKIKALLFDLDGTLVNALDDITNSVNHTLVLLSLVPLPKETIREFIGDGILKLLERSLSTQVTATPAMIEKAYKIYAAHHDVHCLDHVRLYPNVTSVLDYFSKLPMAVVSNKGEKFTKKILDGLSISHYFKIILGGDSLPEKKPSPVPILHVIHHLSLEPEYTLMVGDGRQDMESGRAAGIRTAHVRYSFNHHGVVPSDFVLEDIQDLIKISQN